MTERRVFALDDTLARRLLADAGAAGEKEICGFIASATGRQRAYRIANTAAAARTRFEMDPAEQIAAFRDQRLRGERLLAIYHSHPLGEAEPSAADIAGHSYPEALALIIAPKATRAAMIRAWHMIGSQPCEVTITTAAAFL